MTTDPLHDTDPSFGKDQVHDAVIREQIHQAFDRVALSSSCGLSMLLTETRRRGIYDHSVKHLLELDEAATASSEETDMHLRLFCSNAGVIYVARNTAPSNERVSTCKAFTR